MVHAHNSTLHVHLHTVKAHTDHPRTRANRATKLVSKEGCDKRSAHDYYKKSDSCAALR